jgi:hypothetical protein
MRNTYTLQKKSTDTHIVEEISKLATVTAKPYKLLYHYDTSKHSFLKKKITELEEIA